MSAWSNPSVGPDMRPTNTSSIRRPMSASLPLQWNGSVPRRPVCSDCVRRSPSQVKFHTRPSSLPSAWHDAHARFPPAFEWKIRWPVSARLSVDSVIGLAPRPSESIAGSRDWTTSAPAPSNATAIGSPTTWGTSGSGTPHDAGRRRRPPRPTGSCWRPPTTRWGRGRACRPGSHPTLSSVVLSVSDMKTRGSPKPELP